VDHLCYKCQTSIDETLPFCPHCGAPQIRVATPESDQGESRVPSQTPLAQAAPPVWTSVSAYQARSVQWEFAWKGALLTGLLAAVLTALPYVGFGCCLWMLGTGALAVGLYQRRVPGAYITPGMGMRIGALSGATAFLVTAFWNVLQFARNSQEFRSVFIEQMEKTISANQDPRTQEVMRQFMNNLNTPEGLATFFVIILVVMAVVFVFFSAAGGAFGASMFGRRSAQ
jgi:hypothetical protein